MFFIEPQATLAVLHTEIDDVDIFGGTVEFDDQTSFRGRLGLRIGFDHTDATGTVYSADVTGSAWEDFSGDNEVTIANSGLPNFSVSDDPGQTIGDVSLGLSMASPEGWSGFLRGNYLFGTDYEAVSGNAGVRWAW
jgi:outer membrane autotransporter protein